MDDIGPVFTASYYGLCVCGDSQISPGDDVRYVDGELCLVDCCADDQDHRDASLGFEP